MYRVAAQLDPSNYQALATAVFAEMLVSEYTAVGKFHYVHHRAHGAPYEAAHAMELALAAARAVGIRLVLLDTLYLTGGIGRNWRRSNARSATEVPPCGRPAGSRCARSSRATTW